MLNVRSKPWSSVALLFGLLSAAGLVLLGHSVEASGEVGLAFVGGEFRVNTYTQDNQSFPEIAMAPDGSAVVAWESIGQDDSNHAVAAQRYGSDGSRVGAEFIVNTETEDTQSQPSVAMADDGSFIIFWRSKFQDGSEFGVYAQRYSSSGATVGGEFQVNVETELNQDIAYGDYDAGGRLMVAWESLDDSSGGIFGRVYDAAGQAGDEFRLNQTTQSWQHDVEIAGLPSGFIATWESRNVDSDGRAVVFRRYDSSGAPLSDEVQVNITESADQHNPSLAARADGTFAIVWESVGQDGSDAAAMARIYTSSGTPTTGEIQLNQTTIGDQENLDVAYDGQGGFVVVWDGDATSGGSFDEVWGRRLLVNGALDGDEFRVNTNITNRQVFPVIGGSADGQLRAVWHSWTEDGNGTGVAGQRLWVTGVFRDDFETGDTSAWSSTVP
ncbi:MAG: hypothetical protein AAGM22_24520 [Acidobacteriota bacterium]